VESIVEAFLTSGMSTAIEVNIGKRGMLSFFALTGRESGI